MLILAWLNCEKATESDWYKKTIAIEDSDINIAISVKKNLTKLSIGWCLFAVVVSTLSSEWWTACIGHKNDILCWKRCAK